MKPLSGSSIQGHYLESILPHPQLYSPKQFLKSREFYKPQAFIWNNPHRVSDQMYKFYHSYNDKFSKRKQPMIKLQEDQDREEADKQRIHRLIAFRNKAREEFMQKQRSREILEEKTRNGSNTGTRAIRTETGIPLEGKYKSQTSINNEKNTAQHQGMQRNTQNSQRVIRIEGAYRTSLAKHDVMTEEVNRLINEQNEDYQRRIRSQFAARRQSNGINNIKLRALRKRLPQNQ